MAEQFRAGSPVERLIDRLRRPSRYVQIGLICALMTNGIIIGLDQLGAHYLAATLVATVVVTVIGFLLHCAWTYRVTPTAIGFARFVIATAAGSCIAVLSMVALCDGLRLSATAAIPIATVFLFFWNYALATWAIARKPAMPPEG